MFVFLAWSGNVTGLARYVCIHGHFYQPPRESAWLERIERQESAFPFHDWNERIDQECYRANARARLLDSQDRLRKIVNNYARISFNFGPTLLSWLESDAPRTYQAVLEADRLSQANFGRGSAMAQAHGHLILPHCSDRDRRTQVRWGIDDFKRRFQREPEGMWLPETAACTDSLRALAEQGIRFTVLSPRQAKAIKGPTAKVFTDVDESTLDTSRPYRVDVGGGLSIAVFFYDGRASQAVAFERLLSSGDALAGRLLSAFGAETEEDQLVHIATDGETYGHHHRFGEMALAYALDRIEAHPVSLTNYASFLAKHPPTFEAQIVERSSWSCAHGVRRWSDDCGCRTRGDRNQAWRGPLRKALDDLRDRIDDAYEDAAASLVQSPWKMRDEYIALMGDRSPAARETFVQRHRKHDRVDTARVIDLCEMQRFRMAMFTSCGWFFDDVSGIETIQILQYAARAIELAAVTTGVSLGARFLGDLEAAVATGPGEMSARDVYESLVKPAQVDALRVAAAFVMLCLFNRKPIGTPAFEIEEHEVRLAKQEKRRTSSGRLSVLTTISGRRRSFAFVAVHRGGPDVFCALRELANVRQEVSELERFDVEAHDTDRLDQLIAGFPYRFDSLSCLPPDDRAVVVSRIVAEAAARAEDTLRTLFAENVALLTELAATGVRLPPALVVATRVVLETDLERATLSDPPDAFAMKRLVMEARVENVRFDERAFAFQLAAALRRSCERLRKSPADAELAQALETMIEVGRALDTVFEAGPAEDLVYSGLREESSLAAEIQRTGAEPAWERLAAALRIAPA